jgi:hypothetical protein
MPRLYDHIDLRVRTLAEGRDFYEVLLPALGFVRETSGFLDEQTLPVEGPLWLSPYVIDNFNDRQRREHFLALMRRVEQEPLLLGTTGHLLAVARKAQQ